MTAQHADPTGSARNDSAAAPEIEERIVAWTDAVHAAQREHVQIPGPSQSLGELSHDQAYEVQDRVVAHRIESGERQLGWKVGATSLALLEQMKGQIDEPIYGAVMSPTTWQEPDAVCAADFSALTLEAEIGVVLATPLRGPNATRLDVLAAAAGALAAVEISDGRLEAGTANLADGLADSAYHGGLILGSPMRPAVGFDFFHEGVVVRKNGRLVGSGCGAEAYGHPLDVVAWLANALARRGRGLEAGQVVSTGSLTQPFPAEVGDRIDVSFANLGRIAFTIVP